jgi:hypothetical protein
MGGLLTQKAENTNLRAHYGCHFLDMQPVKSHEFRLSMQTTDYLLPLQSFFPMPQTTPLLYPISDPKPYSWGGGFEMLGAPTSFLAASWINSFAKLSTSVIGTVCGRQNEASLGNTYDLNHIN